MIDTALHGKEVGLLEVPGMLGLLDVVNITHAGSVLDMPNVPLRLC